MPEATATRITDDRWELKIPHSDPFRILQITDTHFGSPYDNKGPADHRTRELIHALVEEHQPDLVYHTGDLIENDQNGVITEGLEWMKELGRPWAFCFGNHDHEHGNEGGIPKADYYDRIQGCLIGRFQDAEGGWHYCTRIDVVRDSGAPIVTLIGMDTGFPGVGYVKPPQLKWLKETLAGDGSHPVLLFQHIPTIEYQTVVEEGRFVGRAGEKVCNEEDRGEAFAAYKTLPRIKAMFVGHDHVNDFVADHEGIRLVYGRAASWSSYGDWERGGRLITCTENETLPRTRVVLPAGSEERPEWSVTLKEI